MPEIQKYNLNEKLAEANERYKGSPAVAGMSAMTHFRYNNSTRTQMFTSHLNQVINMPNPEFPLVMTGAENTVGKHSSCYKKAKNNIKIFRKVVKFKNLVDRPYVYQLFYYDKKKKRYDVFQRQEVIDLSQNYGVSINNDVIDSIEEGDDIAEGTVLWKSISYDENMNYRFGANLRVAYTFDPFTAEDAAEISEYASEKLSTTKSEILKFGWNTNDIPINLYGGEESYQPLPYIGQEVEGVVVAARPQINEQLAYDFKHSNLQTDRDGDRVKVYNGTGRVVDFTIHCNNYEMLDDSFNHQIIEYLNSQREYWQEIFDTCEEIRASGEDFTKKVDDLYCSAMNFLDKDDKARWYNGASTFGNIECELHVTEITPLAEGGKFTARFGNKSVVSRVLPNHLMPFDSDGVRVDVFLHLPAISNRTTGYVPHEQYINWAGDLTVREMRKLKTKKEKEILWWNFVRDLNEDQYKKMYAVYKAKSKKDQEEELESTMEHGIIIHQDSINEDESIFFKLYRMSKKYPYLKPQTLYQYKWGRIYRVCSRYCPGKMYFMPLKQTDQKGFSGRNTGAVNMKGLPERSYKNKKNEAAFSDTAIRFGEYETLNFLIGVDPEEFALVHAFYRSSPEATSDLTKAQFVERGMAMFKKFYKNRAAEIFNVLYKHLSLELVFRDKNMKINPMDSKRLTSHIYKGKTYLMTDFEFHNFKVKEEIREKILEERPVITTKELEIEIERRSKKTANINGVFDETSNILGTSGELVDLQYESIKLKKEEVIDVQFKEESEVTEDEIETVES